MKPQLMRSRRIVTALEYQSPQQEPGHHLGIGPNALNCTRTEPWSVFGRMAGPSLRAFHWRLFNIRGIRDNLSGATEAPCAG